MQSNIPDRSDTSHSDTPNVTFDSSRDSSVPNKPAAATEATTSTSSPAPVVESLRNNDASTALPAMADTDTFTQDASTAPVVPIADSGVEKDTSPASPPLWRNVLEMVGWAALACLLTLVNRFAGAFISLPPPESVPGHLAATLYLAPLLLSLLQTARIAVSLPLSTPFLFTVGTVLALPSLLVVFLTLTRVEIPAVTYFYSLLSPVLRAIVNNFFGPIGLSLLGAAIGRVIKHPNTLLAAAGFSIFFDIIVVTMGTVRQLMNSGSNLIAAVSVGAGAPPSTMPGVPQVKLPDPISAVTIGPADVLFLALFLSAVAYLRYHWQQASREALERSWRETLGWMYGLLLLALVLVEFFYLPIPALVPMGIAVLIGNARLAAFTPAEKRYLMIGSVFALFCAGLMILWARLTIPPAPPQLGIQLGQDARSGRILLVKVVENSPAERAGLRPGMELLAINGISIKGMTEEEFQGALQKAPERGLTVRIRRPRADKPEEIKVDFHERSMTYRK